MLIRHNGLSLKLIYHAIKGPDNEYMLGLLVSLKLSKKSARKLASQATALWAMKKLNLHQNKIHVVHGLRWTLTDMYVIATGFVSFTRKHR
jgi:hypothetical protein